MTVFPPGGSSGEKVCVSLRVSAVKIPNSKVVLYMIDGVLII
jgi:hypothetical protein